MLVIHNWLPFSLSSFLGTLDLWPTGHTVSGGGGSSKPKPKGWGNGVLIGYSVRTFTTCTVLNAECHSDFTPASNTVETSAGICEHHACWHKRSPHEVLGTPFPFVCWFGESCYSPSCKTEPTPLVKLYLFFLPHLVSRNANSQRSAGRSGQAEMPICLGVSSPRQVVPGLHSRPYLFVRLFLWMVFYSFLHLDTVKHLSCALSGCRCSPYC